MKRRYMFFTWFDPRSRRDRVVLARDESLEAVRRAALHRERDAALRDALSGDDSLGTLAWTPEVLERKRLEVTAVAARLSESEVAHVQEDAGYVGEVPTVSAAEKRNQGGAKGNSASTSEAHSDVITLVGKPAYRRTSVPPSVRNIRGREPRRGGLIAVLLGFVIAVGGVLATSGVYSSAGPLPPPGRPFPSSVGSLPTPRPGGDRSDGSVDLAVVRRPGADGAYQTAEQMRTAEELGNGRAWCEIAAPQAANCVRLISITWEENPYARARVAMVDIDGVTPLTHGKTVVEFTRASRDESLASVPRVRGTFELEWVDDRWQLSPSTYDRLQGNGSVFTSVVDVYPSSK
ncbi:hypothetical protein [Streptomyces sp. NBC_00878]|uniref:hypothetical protein n=1 Tax=Streptomyces sp. NBC_00878 TaxID=2975854 RepID=UPI00224CD863|nr:hypothetical protein [Streptomyces sp. NBC_00878]MCX4906391.1 hypothetical protein [Streptomyces sp. NBC_00878]